MEKVRVITWKMASDRYLHEVKVERGYFHIVTDSSSFWLRSFTLRNKVLAKRSMKEIRGLRKVKEEREEWLSDDDWEILCFGGCDNLELRKKVFGRELKKVIIKLEIYGNGRINGIYVRRDQDSKFSNNLILGHSVRILRNLRKRIKDPLPYIVSQSKEVEMNERLKLYTFTVSILSYIQFNQKIKEWKKY